MHERLSRLKLLLFDVDGVLTDGGIIYGTGDLELKRFNVHDGFGFTLAKAAGFRLGILTGRRAEVVTRRAEELGVDTVRQGCFRKAAAFAELLREQRLAPEEVAYMGDDILDLPVLEQVGFAAAPANARLEVRTRVDYVTKAAGGNGAARECIEFILRELGTLADVQARLARGEIAEGSPG